MFETDGFNCLLYEKTDLLDGEYFFKNIHIVLEHLKKTYPKNCLVKILNSSLWGRLSVKNCRWYDDEAIENANYNITTEIDDDDDDEKPTHLFIDEREK